VGPDGNAYMLLPDRVLVISQSGTVLRTLPFEKYDRDVRAVNLFVSGGLVTVLFYKQVKQSLDATLLVMDGNNGERFGYYAPSADLGNNPICFNRSDGFIFMGMNRDGRVKLKTAVLR